MVSKQLEQSITIINNSGKIISTGRQLFDIFKEAKASYKEKKRSIHHERSLQRSQTFDPSYAPHNHHQEVVYYDEPEYDYGPNPHYANDDARSSASRRSHRSHRSSASHRSRGGDAPRSRPALTMSNLRTHSEISATPPSAPPQNYHSPYAETSRDMTLSRPTLAPGPDGLTYAPPMPMSTHDMYPPPPPHPMQRASTDPALEGKKAKMMDSLAYGDMPPDLAQRTDLDKYDEDAAREAHTLVSRVEALLDEAQCAQHSAGAIIQHLQRSPDSAAAVALTLAELSALLGKMGPGFMSAVQGGAPAVWALLASPQFLIAAGAAVGVTVVMFGGWKIIKRVKEAKEAKEMAAQREAIAFEAHQAHQAQMHQQQIDMGMGMGVPRGVEGDYFQEQHYPNGGHETRALAPEEEMNEALVIERELSGIESWVRGVTPFGEDENADMELISPEAQRAVKRQQKEQRRQRRHSDDEYDEHDRDDVSRSGRSERSHRSSRSHVSHASSHRSHRSRRDRDGESLISERRGSKSSATTVSERLDRECYPDDSISMAGSRRSSASSRRSVRTGEGGKSGDGRERERKAANMLKDLFRRKKEKDEGRAMSVMV